MHLYENELISLLLKHTLQHWWSLANYIVVLSVAACFVDNLLEAALHDSCPCHATYLFWSLCCQPLTLLH